MLEDDVKPVKSLHQQMFPEHHKEMIRACTEAGLEKEKAIHKFKFFFAGLVFAVLSFVIQFPVKTNHFWIKVLESSSWVLFGSVALLALRNIGGFSLEDTNKGAYRTGLAKTWMFIMWLLFFFGVTAILVAKIATSFVA